MADLERIAALPKAELHRHLEGCVRVSTIIDVARRHKTKLPSYDAAELAPLVKVSHAMPELQRVLDVFAISRTVFADYEAIERVAFETLEDALKLENIRLLELRYSPEFMLSGAGLDWQKSFDVIDSAVRGFEKRNGFVCGIILIASRSYGLESALKTAEFAIMNKKRIIGFDFADSEINYPARMFAPAGAKLAAEKIPLTVHSGEEGSFAQILDTLEYLNPRRIGHGVKAAGDASGRAMAALKTRGITVETNPWSNYLTGAVPSVAEHPLKRFIEAGLSVSIGADDTAVLDTDLNNEYRLCVAEMGLSFDDIAYANSCALKASFLDPDRRREAAKLMGSTSE